jgi:hypothetical protein
MIPQSDWKKGQDDPYVIQVQLCDEFDRQFDCFPDSILG